MRPFLADAVAPEAPAKITGSLLEGWRRIQAGRWQTMVELWRRLEEGWGWAREALRSGALIH